MSPGPCDGQTSSGQWCRASQPPLLHVPPSPRKEPVAFILLKPKGFENVPLRLKKWVPKDQLDRDCSPGPEPACGAQRAIPGYHVSLRLRYATAFAHDHWHPGQGQASVQRGGSRPCSVTWQFLPRLFPFEEYCCNMKPAHDARERILPTHSSQLKRWFHM